MRASVAKGATTLVRRGPWLTLSLVGLAMAVGSSGELEFNRAAVLQGEWWRVLTGHWVHYGRAHAIGDILGFLAWASVLELISRRLLATAVMLTVLTTGLGVLFLCPSVSSYAGLSAIDVGLATVLLCVLASSPMIRQLPGSGPLIALIFAGHVFKATYEVTLGKAILAPDLGEGVVLLPAAHLFGAVAGALAWWAWRSDLRCGRLALEVNDR